MVKQNRLTALKDIAKAKFQSKQLQAAPFLKKEAQLRADLAKIEAQSKANARIMLAADDANTMAAGPVWQGWVAARKIALQSAVAENAVQKAKVLDELAKAFGRQQALSELIKLENDRVADRRAFSTELCVGVRARGTCRRT